VEKLFFSATRQAIAVGQARGVVLPAIACRRRRGEYANEQKQAGRIRAADKRQVQMVRAC
jgi:Holliday junction resolvasome RuvABC endonuclease subunit